MEILRDDDGLLSRLRQASMSKAYPGVIKAFHYHEHQDDLWFFPAGNAQVVLYVNTSIPRWIWYNTATGGLNQCPTKDRPTIPTTKDTERSKTANNHERKYCLAVHFEYFLL